MENRKSKEWWKDHYDSWLASDLSIAAYSNNNSISKSTFYFWIKKFRKMEDPNEESKTKLQWAELKPTSKEDLPHLNIENSSIKITIGKASLEIEKDINLNLLDKVVKILMENA